MSVKLYQVSRECLCLIALGVVSRKQLGLKAKRKSGWMQAVVGLCLSSTSALLQQARIYRQDKRYSRLGCSAGLVYRSNDCYEMHGGVTELKTGESLICQREHKRLSLLHRKASPKKSQLWTHRPH